MFPPTGSSIIRVLGSDDASDRARGWDALTRAYWKPIYKYTRIRWQKPPEDAEDVTQEFFLRVLVRNAFATYDPARVRFRTFLRACLDRFITDQWRQQSARKRGGLSVHLDFEQAEHELAGSGSNTADPQALFDAEWQRHMFGLALARLREELTGKGKVEHLRAFELLYLDDTAAAPPSYAAVAERLGISLTDVTNRLSYARRMFRHITVEILRETAASDEELREQMLELFGAPPVRKE